MSIYGTPIYGDRRDRIKTLSAMGATGNPARLSMDNLNVDDLRRKKKRMIDLAKSAESEGDAESFLDAAETFELQAQAILDDEADSRARASGGSYANDGIRVGRDRFEQDPMKGFRNSRDFLETIIGEGADRAVNATDHRLQFLATAGTDEHVKGSSPYGGFLVPEGLSPASVTPAEDDPFAGRTSPLPMSSLIERVPARVDKNHSSSVSGGLTVSRKAETAAASSSRMELEQVKFEATALFGFAYASEELLTVSRAAFSTLLGDSFTEEFRSMHIKELLRGTGVAEPEGVQNNPALVTVSKEPGQATDTIVWENIIRMRARCWGYSQGIWLYNHDCLPQLLQLTLPIGTSGVSVWHSAGTEGEPDRILGRPAFPSEYMEPVGDLNDIMLIVPSEIREGTYQPLDSAESIHVRFDRHERAFKFWLMNDARSLWRSALTPEQSSDTLSPFVTLAARA